MKIREYKPEDEPSIRKICNDTSFQGKGLYVLFSDGDLWANVFTKYYTKFESKSIFVAEDKGKVIGYITGCVHPKRHSWLSKLIMLTLVPKFIYNYLFKYGKKDKMFIKNVFIGKIPKSPGCYLHFHRNVIEGYRSKGVGTKLKKVFLDYARKATKRRKLKREFMTFDKSKLKRYEDTGYTIYDCTESNIFSKEKIYVASAYIGDFTEDKSVK